MSLLPRTRCSRNKNIDVLAAYHREKIRFMQTQLRAEVVMLFAVERLSERSEDWPTNKKFLEVELNIRAAGLPGAGNYENVYDCWRVI